MQSQCSLDSSFSGPLSLSLSKFSYATVPEDSNAPIPWTHLSSRGSLFAVFEKRRSRDQQEQLNDQSIFKITNGAEVMEDLNLIALAAEARKATDQTQLSNVLHRPSAVTIIIKKPCVAVRYPSGQGQIRRFQIRFLHDTDYYAAMGRFSEAHAPVTEAGTFPAPHPQPRPFSSSSSVLCPSDSASNRNAQPPSTPTAFQPNKSSTSTSSIINRAEEFLRPATSTSAMTYTSSPIQRKPQTILTGRLDRKDVYILPQDAPEPSPVRPHDGTLTSQHWSAGDLPVQTPKQTSDVEPLASHRLPSPATWSALGTESCYPSTNLYKPRPTTAPTIESQGLSEMLPPKRDLPFAKSASRVGLEASKATDGMVDARLPTFTPKEASGPQPSSLVSSHSQEVETQSAPPKAKSKRARTRKTSTRVTKRPAAPRSRKKAASPVPSVEELLRRSQESGKVVMSTCSNVDTQALLAKAKELQVSTTKQAQAEKSNLAPNFAQAATAADLEDQRAIPLASPSRMRLRSGLSLPSESAPQARTTTPVLEVLDSQDNSHCQSQGVPISGQDPLPDCPTAAYDPRPVRPALVEQLQNTVPTRCEPSMQPLTNPLPGPLASLLRDPDFAGSPDLAQWAKESEEERRASLETFICRSLQDENFFQLCKDLEGTWQRVFLGKNV